MGFFEYFSWSCSCVGIDFFMRWYRVLDNFDGRVCRCLVDLGVC